MIMRKLLITVSLLLFTCFGLEDSMSSIYSNKVLVENSNSNIESPELPLVISHAPWAKYRKAYPLKHWKDTYKDGCKHFEMDLYETTDDKVIAYHGNGEKKSHSRFIGKLIKRRYVPMDGSVVAGLLSVYGDWTLYIDSKSDLKFIVNKMCSLLREYAQYCTERIVPFAYSMEDVDYLVDRGFETIILASYKNDLSIEEMKRITGIYRQVKAVAMSEYKFVSMSNYEAQEFREQVRRIYVHTVNGNSGLRTYRPMGAYGIISDDQCGTSQ